jgi:hypothetical protein
VERFDEGSSYFGLLVVAGVMFYVFSNDPWTNSLWYSVKYNVGFNDVRTASRPRDCDFLSAPLGDKGCKYKAYLQVYNADGALVAGDDAPIYGSDTKTGRPIISRDSGKTWDWYYGTTTILNQKPNLSPYLGLRRLTRLPSGARKSVSRLAIALKPFEQRNCSYSAGSKRL